MRVRAATGGPLRCWRSQGGCHEEVLARRRRAAAHRGCHRSSGTGICAAGRGARRANLRGQLAAVLTLHPLRPVRRRQPLGPSLGHALHDAARLRHRPLPAGLLGNQPRLAILRPARARVHAPLNRQSTLPAIAGRSRRARRDQARPVTMCAVAHGATTSTGSVTSWSGSCCGGRRASSARPRAERRPGQRPGDDLRPAARAGHAHAGAVPAPRQPSSPGQDRGPRAGQGRRPRARRRPREAGLRSGEVAAATLAAQPPLPASRASASSSSRHTCHSRSMRAPSAR